MNKLIFAIFNFLIIFKFSQAQNNYPCESDIFCHGPILQMVQLANLWDDGKTYVDLKIKESPKAVWDNYYALMNITLTPTEKQIRDFVTESFDEDSLNQFDPWDVSDWVESPKFLSKINDTTYRNFALVINAKWKNLGRKIKTDVRDHPELYTLIYVEKPFIVPGGRFREFFYWDSYWTFQGLILSQMLNTTKGMLENFMTLVDELGYVPNGGRKYFKRSQPPLLLPMVDLYYKETGDREFIEKYLETMKTEIDFWVQNRTVEFTIGEKNYSLLRYNVEIPLERPEGFRHDFNNKQNFETDAEIDEFLYNIKSGAESGWDFSSRWYKPIKTAPKNELWDTKTREIIPVDLNAFYYKATLILAEFHKILGHADEQIYRDRAETWKNAINEVFWDEREGCWFDYDFIECRKRIEFYISNLTPLWAGIGTDEQTVGKVINYIKITGALDFPGGVPSSMITSGQQWDFPNAWAPLIETLVTAMENTNNGEGKEIAFDVARKWVETTYKGYLNKDYDKTIFEKYDVTQLGYPGEGGLYRVVEGFGWTNGVLLKFLNDYGNRLEHVDTSGNSCKQNASNFIIFIFLIYSLLMFKN